jgi:hypothetical protein
LKKLCYLLILLLLSYSSLYSQRSKAVAPENKIKNYLTDNTANDNKLHSRLYYSSARSNIINNIVETALFMINPDVAIENGKVYFGLTKEISAGKFPFGRAAFEYTFMFRETGKNNFRFSYNFDIPIAGGQTSLVFLSPGFGYFTDTERTGLFPQLTVGIMGDDFTAGKIFKFNPYIKFRRTFVKGSGNPNFTDVSLGCGIAFFY